MKTRASIRPDIHERFITVFTRVEARMKAEEKDTERRLAEALARDNEAQAAARDVRASARLTHEYDDDDEREPSSSSLPS